jgi:hypothetical protein
VSAQLLDTDAEPSRVKQGLTVAGLTVVTRKHKTPVVEDVSFSVPGARCSDWSASPAPAKARSVWPCSA